MDIRFHLLFVCLLFVNTGYCLRCYAGAITSRTYHVRRLECGYGKTVCLASTVTTSTLFGTITTKAYGCEKDMQSCHQTCNRIRAKSRRLFISSCNTQCCGSDLCNTSGMFG
ncbi:uncharacterized protein LOC130648748 isoform X2 [Hydractinia symbiolongicarpus]|uniref:uncharacterized protein LOC130648748 isoform X2 n=1 Tax=Hydractinia symbiolongicarpus TaxID=13093 RepID=UPI00254F2E24|nr:uncharacterized protein LOC130648748 isoform X2 [Hydractinia symbiolongicarpus]